MDVELISILQRAWLLPKGGVTDPAAESKFSLDSKVGDEGFPPSLDRSKCVLIINSRVQLQCGREAASRAVSGASQEYSYHLPCRLQSLYDS